MPDPHRGGRTTLAWEEVDGAATYRVERSIDGFGFVLYKTITNGATGLAAATVPDVGTDAYQVVAVDNSGIPIDTLPCTPFVPRPPGVYTYGPGGEIVGYTPTVWSAADYTNAATVCAGQRTEGLGGQGWFTGSTPVTGKTNRVTIANSYFMDVPAGETWTVNVSGPLYQLSTAGVFGSAYRFFLPNHHSNYFNYGTSGGVRTISQTSTVSTPGYVVFTMENGYTVTPGSAFHFNLDITVTDSAGNVVEDPAGADPCRVFDQGSWAQWNLLWVVTLADGTVGAAPLPSTCTELIAAKADWLADTACTADLTAAGIDPNLIADATATIDGATVATIQT